jgi:tripartite-type tricarboxylate transporter receptor subunit TctC
VVERIGKVAYDVRDLVKYNEEPGMAATRCFECMSGAFDRGGARAPHACGARATDRWIARALVAFVVFGTALAESARAQAWPAKTLRIIVPFPPGGGLDFFARLTAQKLQDGLGQQIVVENRSGASGMVGADVVAKAAPDGYTVLFSTAAEITINPHLYARMAYDPLKDLAPVSYAAHAALLFSVHPSIPAKTLPQLVGLARSRPGQLNYASAGTGSVHHLAGELLKSTTGIDIVHVPYKGAGPAVIDMVGGQVSMGFTALPSSLPHVRTGRLRPLAVTSARRSEAAPEIPSFVELGHKAIDVVSWYGVLVPARTPGEVVARLSAEVARAVQAPDVKARLLEQGIEVVGTDPADFAKFIRSETTRYAEIIRRSGAKPD